MCHSTYRGQSRLEGVGSLLPTMWVQVNSGYQASLQAPFTAELAGLNCFFSLLSYVT